jgi:hypothetical protein
VALWLSDEHGAGYKSVRVTGLLEGVSRGNGITFSTKKLLKQIYDKSYEQARFEGSLRFIYIQSTGGCGCCCFCLPMGAYVHVDVPVNKH